MKTEIITLDKKIIDRDKLRYAADILKAGGLVAFPTETVYGLGANALNEKAVKKIFEAKGRPADNPLIVHIAEIQALDSLVCEAPRGSARLMEKFWPGPLTLVLKKSAYVPDIISAGLDTVAIRMPSHPVAIALIRECGLPLAAPSANTSGRPSPTQAKHVIEDMMGRVDVIIDGGTSSIGLESTVLDITTCPPMVLRPGGITLEQLRQELGEVSMDPALGKKPEEGLKPKSPGMKYTHYSPKADVFVVEGNMKKVVQRINELALEYINKGIPVGILATEQTKDKYPLGEVISMGDRESLETIANRLFWAFRECDDRNLQMVLAEAVEYKGVGLAVMNRMVKAAGYHIIKV